MPTFARCEKIRKRLQTLPFEAAYLVKKHENISYLSGFTGSFGLLVLAQEEAFLITDSRYKTQAQNQAPGCQVLILEGRPWFQVVEDLMQTLACGTLVLDKKEWTLDAYEALQSPHYQLEGRVDWVEDLRMLKSPEEVTKIQEAQRLAEEALEASLSLFRIGRREREMALDLEWAMRTRGASALSFPTILASGARGAMPHGQASDKRLEAGDLVVVDFGCVLDGYCSDMTRTFAMGSADAWSRDLYQKVRTAQDLALAEIRAGVTGESMQRLVQDYFDQEGYGEAFGHGLGHGIGLEVHEKPNFSAHYKGTIPAGAVLSVEPGLYIPGRAGVRIEDLVVIEEGGVTNLNRFPKDLMVLDP